MSSEVFANYSNKLEKGSLHLIHGLDVARLVLAMTNDFTKGERWLVTDFHVYDWFFLIKLHRGPGNSERRLWLEEVLREKGIMALPRDLKDLGRSLNSSHVWRRFNLSPTCFPLTSFFDQEGLVVFQR